MTPPINIGGDTVDAITIDGTSVSEVTVDGEVVFGSAIPDSGRYHLFDFRDNSTLTTSSGSIESIEDKEKSTTVLDTGTISGGFGTINGQQTANLDGSDDSLESDITNISQPFDVHVVSQISKTPVGSVGERPFGGQGTFSDMFYADSDEYALFAGSALERGSVTSSPIVFSGHFDGVNSEIYVNGSQVGSAGDAGTNSLTGITIGAGAGGGNHFEGQIGYEAVYDPTAAGYDIVDTAKAIQSDWGI
jgi:hypothetical protein